MQGGVAVCLVAFHSGGNCRVSERVACWVSPRGTRSRCRACRKTISYLVWTGC